MEVDERITEEEVVKEEAAGEAFSPVTQMDYQNDVSRAIEPHRELIRSGSGTTGKSVAPAGTIIGDTSGIHGVACLSTKGQEESQVDGTIAKNQDGGASLHDKWGRCGENSVLCGRETDALPSNVDTSRRADNGELYCKEETDQTSVEDLNQVPSRVSARSASPNIEFSNGSKRQAIICDFFSKGWCIKGSTCRFIHKSDHGAVSSQYNKGNLDSTKKNTKPLEAEASSILHIPLDKDGQIPGEKSEIELPLQKGDRLAMPSFTFGGGSFTRELNKEHCHYSSPVAKNSSFHGMLSSRTGTATENYRNASIPCPLTSSDAMPQRIYQSVTSDHDSSLPNSSLCKPPMSVSYSSWKPDSIYCEKLMNNSSKLASPERNISSFSGRDTENLSRPNIFSDMQNSAGTNRKMSFNWEASAPFRPSFYITQRLLSPGSLYDPIRDSIEQTSLRNGPPKPSYSGVGTSMRGATGYLNDNMVPKGMLGSEFGFSKYSYSGQNQNANYSIRSFPAKDSCETDTASLISVGGQWGNSGTFLTEEKLNSYDIRDVKEADEIQRDHDSELQNVGSSQKTEVREEKVGRNTDADLDLKVDLSIKTDFQKDSKTLKYFHAALVKFVKELLKPTWHEGGISKDAHKMIVKKAVKKVLGSLQPCQIPSTSESVEQYLSSSETKIAKLIEGYVDKYRKS